MKKSDFKIGYRLASILLKLTSNPKVNVNQLANEFDVNVRTIQHDLNERFAPLNIQTDTNGNYWMDTKFRGLLSVADLKKFSDISGALDMLPTLDSGYLQEILEDHISEFLLIKSPFKGNIRVRKDDFENISSAIINNNILRFTYKNRRYTTNPYKLFNIEGIWYLCATHDSKLKTFRFLEIYKINRLTSSFNPDPAINPIIESSDSIWMGNTQKQTVKLRVIPDFVDYFIERIDIPGQKEIIKEKDGSLTVVLDVYFTDEIQSIIKFWIPNIEILEPIELKEEINNQLLGYLNKTTT